MLGPHDIGRRVVVRRIAGQRDNRPLFTDLLGHLVAYSETDLTIRTRTGSHRVPHLEIALAKTVPDKRRPTATEALELAAAAGWPAGERELLGDWWLRATDGWTRRGNSALPVGDPGLPLDAAIDAVTDWYERRGLPPAIAVPLPLRAGLDAELGRRGWRVDTTTLVRTTSLADLLATAPVRPDLPGVRLDPTPSPAWLAVAARRKRSLPAAALGVLTGVPEVRFASVYAADGGLLAIARGVIADDERRWLGVALVEVAESARRRGLAGHVMRALAEWAVETGARDAYLQVEAHNIAARGLYDRLGFVTRHEYAARVLDRPA